MNELRFLRAYALVVTLASGTLLLSGIVQRSNAEFQTLTVHQLRIVDDGGTTRLALFGKDKEPTAVTGGHVLRHRAGQKSAGLMFYNDNGDEIGGMVYGSGPSGGVGQSLTFDAYHQDQVVQLTQTGDAQSRSAYLIFNQVPLKPIWETEPAVLRLLSMPHGAARSAERERLIDAGLLAQPRLVQGLDENQDAKLAFLDKYGRPRLLLTVAANGNPEIQFLDKNGRPVKTITGTP